mmetsp:Transcript_84852/g.220974  ORF Transcript_84852/g.220974 Transcript_84852/m.220974 type:complete len:303 (-) Transcript_84852:714-1622(-)
MLVVAAAEVPHLIPWHLVCAIDREGRPLDVVAHGRLPLENVEDHVRLIEVILPEDRDQPVVVVVIDEAIEDRSFWVDKLLARIIPVIEVLRYVLPPPHVRRRPLRRAPQLPPRAEVLLPQALGGRVHGRAPPDPRGVRALARGVEAEAVDVQRCDDRHRGRDELVDDGVVRGAQVVQGAVELAQRPIPRTFLGLWHLPAVMEAAVPVTSRAVDVRNPQRHPCKASLAVGLAGVLAFIVPRVVVVEVDVRLVVLWVAAFCLHTRLPDLRLGSDLRLRAAVRLRGLAQSAAVVHAELHRLVVLA